MQGNTRNINLMTKQEVYTKLGKKPFDVIATQADGYSIVLYKYRKIHTILNDQNENTVGANGEKEYGTLIQDMYIIFNKDSKLELVISKNELENLTFDEFSNHSKNCVIAVSIGYLFSPSIYRAFLDARIYALTPQ